MKKLLVAVAAAVAIVALILLMRGPTPEAVTAANAAEAAPTPTQTTAPVVPLPPPPPAATVTATATTAPLTAPPDEEVPPAFAAKREEIEAIAARGDVSKLPELLKTDITDNGYVAAATIDAVGKLAALAPEKEKKEAVGQLGKWLKSETKRKAPESMGNVSIIVDAMQDSKSDAAIAPLVEALDSAQQPLHIETRIVEALSSLNATSAVPSIERFAGRVRALQPQDEFQKELAAEALVAADAAVKKLHG